MEQQKVEYRGKKFTVPVLSTEGIRLVPSSRSASINLPSSNPVLQDLNTIWDLQKFRQARLPVSVGLLDASEIRDFTKPGVPRVLDMPIKFPGSEFRLPKELAQFAGVVQRVADFEFAANRAGYDEYYCYLTVDQGEVPAGALQREAPCHVDGFQGARWNPKLKINHSYTVGDVLPTVYYPQPFDFSQLDEAKHDFFWEMNRQVAMNNSAFAWQAQPGEITMMDAYCVHRGTQAEVPTKRTWVRLSFEVRQFDRLGNAHNPMFSYDWQMVPRDSEGLNLTAFDPTSDPSLRRFPWQDLDGKPVTDRTRKSQPNLRPGVTNGIGMDTTQLKLWSDDLSIPERAERIIHPANG